MTEVVIGHDGHSPVPLPRDVLTDEQIEGFLTQVAAAVGVDLAAREIGMTATRMRYLLRRDPDLWERFEQARDDGQAYYRDRLRAQARLRALNQENPSDRILEVELATHGGDEYAHLRRDRARIEGRVEHAITLDPAMLDALPLEQLEQLRDLLRAVGGDVIDGEARELEPGE